MKDNLLIYQKYIEFLYYTNSLIKKYPKSEKFALVQKIKQTLYSGLRNLLYALKCYNKNDKLKYLNELITCLNSLKIDFHSSYSYHYITIQNYTTCSEHITNLCNMLEIWISSCIY